MSSDDSLVDAVANALFDDWFPTGNDVDSEPWRENARKDAEIAVTTARRYLATLIEAHARENHRHLDVGGLCPINRSSADNCDLVAAYRNAARLVRGE